jgi:hypothetical protein
MNIDMDVVVRFPLTLTLMRTVIATTAEAARRRRIGIALRKTGIGRGEIARLHRQQGIAPDMSTYRGVLPWIVAKVIAGIQETLNGKK